MGAAKEIPSQWINDSRQFQQLCEQWQKCNALFMDTEFERRSTYYPQFALLQIFDGTQIYFVDPLQVTVNKTFQAICKNKNIVKVLHSCKEDLEVFYHSWQCEFSALFDTQLAQAFLTGDLAISYLKLVEEICEIKLDKTATRSNWLKRPLSDTQLAYAANDVLYLPKIYHQQLDLLKHKSFKNIFSVECQEIGLQVKKTKNPQAYRFVSQAWTLGQQQLALLEQLYLWREQQAMQENKVLKHIFTDGNLVQIARRQPQSKQDFYALKDLHPRSLRHYWQAIVELIEKFNQSTHKKPDLVINPLELEPLKKLVNQLNKLVKQQASQLSISEKLLLSKRGVNNIAYCFLANEKFPDLYQGWRGAILEPLFTQAFSEFSGQAVNNSETLASVYRSNKKTDMYLYISKRDDFSIVPQELLKIFGKPEFSMQINLGKLKKLARVDINKVKENLSQEGYFLQMPPTAN